MITFCIPSKNNLRYLKPCIKSIKDNSYFPNEILVYVDQDKDGTVEWLETQDVNFIINASDTPKGIGHAYDTMFKQADREYVIAFHADMILGPHADKYMLDIKTKNNIVCATRIEPPLHPPGQEKIVQDFGMWPEDLKMEEFKNFVRDNASDKITKSIFAPWLIRKDQHLGHDPIFRSVFEDADLFRRFKLQGYDLIQSWSAMVYHLTCRGGQFAHAEKMEDFQKKDEAWQINNSISMNEYIRKWGGFLKQTDTLEPIPNVKYDIGLEVTSCNKMATILNQLEPYFNNLKFGDEAISKAYIDTTDYLSSFDIRSKYVDELTNDIIVSVDYNDLILDSNSIMQLVQTLPDILTYDVPEPGDYELGIFKLRVNKVEEKRPKLKLC
jgi:glycosyltransferase involved in cell wall biosynthesis